MLQGPTCACSRRLKLFVGCFVVNEIEELKDNIKRWFLILVGIGGATASGYLVVNSLVTGTASGIFWFNFNSYPRSTHGPQFWFSVLFWSAAFLLFAYIALREYRG